MRQIKKDTIFYSNASEGQQLLRSSEVSIGSLWNTRAQGVKEDTKRTHRLYLQRRHSVDRCLERFEGHEERQGSLALGRAVAGSCAAGGIAGQVGLARIQHGNIDASQQSVAEFANVLLSTNAVPVLIGGDGTVTLPLLQAASRRYSELAVVHLDAYTDAYPLAGNAGPTAFHRAAESRLIDPAASFHIGLRGPVAFTGLYAHARQLGYQLVTMAELLDRGIVPVFDEVVRRLAGRSVYICWDMDFFDPSVAPGAITPSLPREAPRLCRGGSRSLTFQAVVHR